MTVLSAGVIAAPEVDWKILVKVMCGKGGLNHGMTAASFWERATDDELSCSWEGNGKGRSEGGLGAPVTPSLARMSSCEEPTADTDVC